MVDVVMGGGDGLQAVKQMKEAQIVMKRAAKKTYAMAQNAMQAAQQAEIAEQNLEKFLYGSPVVVKRGNVGLVGLTALVLGSQVLGTQRMPGNTGQDMSGWGQESGMFAEDSGGMVRDSENRICMNGKQVPPDKTNERIDQRRKTLNTFL